jgi:hypothetical protein
MRSSSPAIRKNGLEHEVKPAVVKFLAERGLVLSPEKTKITHIKEGVVEAVEDGGDNVACIVDAPAMTALEFMADMTNIFDISQPPQLRA